MGRLRTTTAISDITAGDEVPRDCAMPNKHTPNPGKYHLNMIGSFSKPDFYVHEGISRVIPGQYKRCGGFGYIASYRAAIDPTSAPSRFAACPVPDVRSLEPAGPLYLKCSCLFPERVRSQSRPNRGGKQQVLVGQRVENENLVRSRTPLPLHRGEIRQIGPVMRKDVHEILIYRPLASRNGTKERGVGFKREGDASFIEAEISEEEMHIRISLLF
ncbi:hypothetical protein Trydic_g5016 [Trypoxylus dichotomus]